MQVREIVDLHKLGMGKKTLVMGIVNVTPDSFSDGGQFFDYNKAIAHAISLVESGADILDIGAESTRPGHQPVTLEEEWRRLAPVLRQLRKEVSVPLSLDSYKAEVAHRAVAEGVDIINDVWGGLADEHMYDVVATTGVPYVLMHNSTLKPHQTGDIVTLVRDELLNLVAKAEEKGVRRDQIILDPGVGFGKTVQQNMQLINGVDVLRSTRFPVLLGTSRKSIIGHVLGLAVDDRLEGTAATVALSAIRGADVVRVHDVKFMARIVAMCDAMVRSYVPS